MSSDPTDKPDFNAARNDAKRWLIDRDGYGTAYRNMALAFLAKDLDGSDIDDRIEAARSDERMQCAKKVRHEAEQHGGFARELLYSLADGIAAASQRDVLVELEHEIRRLRANPCPTMRFGFSPKDIANAVQAEVD